MSATASHRSRGNPPHASTSHASFRVLGLFLPAALALACGGDATGRGASYSSDIGREPLVDTVAFAEAFEVVRSLSLEETEEVVTVSPRISTDGTGELLVADPQEAQVRVYDRYGSLRGVLGRKGNGPGEFQMPLSARRATDGRIVVADAMLARITFFAPDADSTSTVIPPVQLIMDAYDLDNDRFLFAGPGGEGDAPRFLHIWNAQEDRVERRFLPMGVPEESRAVASTFTSVSAALEADTIWAVWALSDTLYKFSRRGDALGKLPLALPRPMGQLPTPDEFAVGYTGMSGALDSITQLSDVFVTEGGDMVIQAVQPRGRLFECDLLIMNRLGQVQLQLVGSPRLLLVDQDLFYFADPTHLIPNRIVVAKRRINSQ